MFACTYEPCDVNIHTDSKLVFNGTPNRNIGNAANDDLWQNVWYLYNELIATGWTVNIYQIKAHTDQEDIRQCVFPAKDRHGNATADYLARQAAKIEQVPDNKVELNQWIDSTAWSIIERIATIMKRFSDAEQEQT